MLVVETIATVMRASFQDKKPIKQIRRELRVSRKTARKVVRSGATEFKRHSDQGAIAIAARTNGATWLIVELCIARVLRP
jgi:hypothetical protein